MADFIEMTCKSCGGKLKITPEIDDFACMYCGTEFRVRREGGIVALTPLVDEMRKVSVSTDKTASELAIIRLKEEISEIRKQKWREEEQFSNWRTEENKLVKGIKNQGQINKQVTIGLFAGICIVILLSIQNKTSLGFGIILVGLILFFASITYLLIRYDPYDIYRNNEEEEILEIIDRRTVRFKENEKIFTKSIRIKEQELEQHKKIVGGLV